MAAFPQLEVVVATYMHGFFCFLCHVFFEPTMKRVTLIVVFLCLIGMFCWRFSYLVRDSDRYVYALPLLLSASWFIIKFGNSDVQGPVLVRNAVIWINCIVVLILVSSFKENIITALMPNRPVMMSDGAMRITLSQDRHFHMEVMMNANTMDCLVDTGASGILISSNDAKAIGIKSAYLVFDIPHKTANGLIYTARTVVDDLRVGTIVLRNAPVYVHKDSKAKCLLGMSFLSAFQKISIEGEQMVLSQIIQ